MTTKKGTRLADILDESSDSFADYNWVFDKFILLLTKIEDTNPNIDDFNLRWVEHKIEKFDDGVFPNKEDLVKANTLWRYYNG